MDIPWTKEQDEVERVIDPESGYCLSESVALQGYPFWWEDTPDIYARIRSERARLGIQVDDFPDGPLKRTQVRVAGRLVGNHGPSKKTS